MRILILTLLLTLTFDSTFSKEASSTPSPPKLEFAEPKTPGTNNILSNSSDKHAPCPLVTSGLLDLLNSNLLTFITYCGKDKSLGRLYPLYNYSLKSSENPDSKKTVLTKIPAAIQTGRALVSETWTSLQKLGSDTIVTSAIIFFDGSWDSAKILSQNLSQDSSIPSKADYVLYVVTSNWRETKFTSFVDLGHPDYYEMTPFHWDGAILISGCLLRCYYGLISSENNKTPMTLASYEFRSIQLPDGPPPVDLTDVNNITRTSPLLCICEDKKNKTLLYLEEGSSSCQSPSWSKLSTGMLFHEYFYLFSSNRVYAFSEEAFKKPGIRVPLVAISLKTFFDEVDDDDGGNSTTKGSRTKTETMVLATVYWIILVILLLIIVLVVVYFAIRKNKTKKQLPGKDQTGKDSLKKSGKSSKSSGGKKLPVLSKNSSQDLKQKQTGSRMTLATKPKPSTVVTSKASSMASSPAEKGRPSSALAVSKQEPSSQALGSQPPPSNLKQSKLGAGPSKENLNHLKRAPSKQTQVQVNIKAVPSAMNLKKTS